MYFYLLILLSTGIKDIFKPYLTLGFVHNQYPHFSRGKNALYVIITIIQKDYCRLAGGLITAEFPPHVCVLP